MTPSPGRYTQGRQQPLLPTTTTYSLVRPRDLSASVPSALISSSSRPLSIPLALFRFKAETRFETREEKDARVCVCRDRYSRCCELEGRCAVAVAGSFLCEFHGKIEKGAKGRWYSWWNSYAGELVHYCDEGIGACVRTRVCSKCNFRLVPRIQTILEWVKSVQRLLH